MQDPTQGTDNWPFVFFRDNMVLASVQDFPEEWPAGTFHYRLGYNALGEILYRSAYGPGATGSVNGY